MRAGILAISVAMIIPAAMTGQPVRNPRPPGPGPRVAVPKAPKGDRAAKQRAVIDRLNQMSPEERKQALKDLPPERQKQIERRLETYGKMSPEERQNLRERLDTFRQLPPERQNQARRVFRQFTNLPDERKPVLRGEFERLRVMPEAERRARINSDEFRNRYSPHERRILEEWSDLAAEAGRP